MAGLAGAQRRAFVLIGFMGAGKSTMAAALAERLGVTALDSDRLLEERLGHTIAEEFERAEPAPVAGAGSGEAAAPAVHRGGGEGSFRAIEEELVCELLANAADGAVIALGGGSVLSERVRRALDSHVVVWLDVDGDEAWRRVGPNGSRAGAERPLARDRGAFLTLHAERRALYEGLADAHLPPLELADVSPMLGALRALARAPRGTRLVWARSASGDYPVFVGRGLLREVAGGETREPWPLLRPGSRPFCVTDETVRALYAAQLPAEAQTIAIPPGEASKTLASAERVWRALVVADMTRGDHVVALGGGVVGDLAGFCAAGYQRGVPIVHMPTTLLAQVDSAYGGKTGVDLPEAKNYVGVYHQPAGVLVDPDALATLPVPELAAGWVEVLKTALIAGGPLWETVAHGSGAHEAIADIDEDTIVACARTKLAIVTADERDGGRRRLLNLGHTVGHAIETASGYGRYRHGEAVGLGLLAALRLSGQPDLREHVSELLLEHGLPVTLEDVSVDAILEAVTRDKKRLGSSVPFVLVKAPGELRIDSEVSPGELRAAVSELNLKARAGGGGGRGAAHDAARCTGTESGR